MGQGTVFALVHCQHAHLMTYQHQLSISAMELEK